MESCTAVQMNTLDLHMSASINLKERLVLKASYQKTIYVYTQAPPRKKKKKRKENTHGVWECYIPTSV